MRKVHDTHAPKKIRDRRRGHEIRDKSREQHPDELTLGRRRAAFAAMPLLFRSPNPSEKQRIPDKAQDPVGRTRAKNSQPVHSPFMPVPIPPDKLNANGSIARPVSPNR